MHRKTVAVSLHNLLQCNCCLIGLGLISRMIPTITTLTCSFTFKSWRMGGGGCVVSMLNVRWLISFMRLAAWFMVARIWRASSRSWRASTRDCIIWRSMSWNRLVIAPRAGPPSCDDEAPLGVGGCGPLRAWLSITDSCGGGVASVIAWRCV